MFRHLTLAAVSMAALTLSPVPVVTGTALAAPPCGPNATHYCPPDSSGSTYECSDQLGYLRRVYEEDLENVENPNLVSVVPICVGESYGIMRSDGNAGAIRQAIAANDAMTEALFRKGDYIADDVVGVRFTDFDTVILFVHTFRD